MIEHVVGEGERGAVAVAVAEGDVNVQIEGLDGAVASGDGCRRMAGGCRQESGHEWPGGVEIILAGVHGQRAHTHALEIGAGELDVGGEAIVARKARGGFGEGAGLGGRGLRKGEGVHGGKAKN